MDSKLQTHIFNLIVSHQCIPNKGCAYGFTRADIENISKEIVELFSPVAEGEDLYRWIKNTDEPPKEKGFYEIIGKNNQGNPTLPHEVWFSGTHWIIRDGCKVIYWRSKSLTSQPSGDVSILLDAIELVLSLGYDSDILKTALSSYQSSQPSEGKEDWISVEDGLPPKEDKFYYWLYCKKYNNYEQGEYDHERKCFVDKSGAILYYTSHWKVPKPPQSSIKTVNNG